MCKTVDYKSRDVQVIFASFLLKSDSRRVIIELWSSITFYLQNLWPSKYLLVLKTSLRRPQDLPWKRFQHVFNVIILRLPRSLEEALKTSCKRRLENVLKAIWRHLSRRLGRRKIVRLRTSSRCLEDVSWKRLEDMSWRWLEDIIVTKKIVTGYICILNWG